MSDGFVTVIRRSRYCRQPPTIDLHGYTRHKAIKEVEQFLDEHISKMDKKSYKKLRIITGRGLHSTNGYAVLKAVTVKILRERGLNHYTDNKGGRVVVELNN